MGELWVDQGQLIVSLRYVVLRENAYPLAFLVDEWLDHFETT
jgi:hypothetical protein